MKLSQLPVDLQKEVLKEMEEQKTPAITQVRVCFGDAPFTCGFSLKQSNAGLNYWLNNLGKYNEA